MSIMSLAESSRSSSLWRTLWGFGLLALAWLAFSVPCLGQYTTAVINGTVRDTTAAVIPGANVTLQNVETGVKRSSVSNEAGAYVFVEIEPGTYTLVVQKEGFETSEKKGITLAVNESTTYDFTLAVGATRQVVTVEAAAAALQTASAELGDVLGSQSIEALPLNGRNFTQLLTLTAGASPVNVGQGSSGWRTNAFGAFVWPAMNGQTNRSNTWLLDGVSDTEAITATTTVTPVVDDIKEFKIDSHNDQAQFGGGLGGVVNIVTKSGTNEFHGAGWEFLRNSSLDSRNPFFAKVNPLRQNQFGANIGGPVILPHYNGKNRTFFFGSYEGYRQHKASQTLYVVPTAQELSGNLSALGTPIYNPFSTQPDPSNPGKYLRDEFTGGIIPPARLDPNMVKFAQAVYPAPVATGVAGFNGLDNSPYVHDGDSYSVRADESMDPSNSLSFRFTRQRSPVTSSGGYMGLKSDTAYDGYNLNLSWLHTFGPGAVLQLRFGRNIGSVGPTTVFSGGDVASIVSDTGFANSFVCGHKFSFRSCMLPSMGISGFVGGGEGNSKPNNNSNTYEWKADFSKVHGRHTFFLGASVDTNNQGAAASSSEGVSFAAFETSNLESTTNTGNALASFLLGVPDNASWGDILNSEHSGKVIGFYIQDQWKATDRLTVNLGIRYDFTLVPIITTTNGGEHLGLTDTDNGTFIMQHNAPPCSSTQFAPCIPGGVLPAHVVVSSNGKLYQNDYTNVQPRVGLAYRIGSKDVLRASFGKVYDNWAGVNQSAQNMQQWPTVGFNLAENLNSTVPTITAENPMAGFTGAYPPPTPFGLTSWNGEPNFRAPYSDQWNFGVQHQLGGNTVLTANYVGSESIRTDIGTMGNTATVPGPGPVSARAPYSYITPTFFDKSIGRASYNAFQFSMHRTSSKGLTYMVSYTWSKTMDIGSDGWYCSEGCSIENMYDLNANKSVAGYDLTHNLTGSLAYQLPVGKGRRFNINRAANYVFGDWALNGILTFTSGLPYNISVCGDIANTGNSSCYERPNLVGDPKISNPSRAQWFNPAAFALPAAYTFGNLGRNAYRADPYKNLDLSLFRDFPITESKRFEFRVEAFNLPNHPTWGVPNSVVNQNLFGVVQSTRSTERQIQFALKFYY